MEIENIVEEKKVKKVKKEIVYNDQDYKCIRQIENPRTGKIEDVEDYRPEYRTPVGKCKIRCAKAFDVPVEHLTESYKQLNAKELDGIMITDFIDRYGFNTLDSLMNRADLAEKYKKNVKQLEIAEDKLKKIIKSEDVLEAYGKYLKEVDDAIEKGRRKKAVIGE